MFSKIKSKKIPVTLNIIIYNIEIEKIKGIIETFRIDIKRKTKKFSTEKIDYFMNLKKYNVSTKYEIPLTLFYLKEKKIFMEKILKIKIKGFSKKKEIDICKKNINLSDFLNNSICKNKK